MSLVDEIRQDVRFGVRALSRRPWLSLTITVILGLATGATAAIFSVVSSVLLRPLPFAAPDRLVEISPRGTPANNNVIRRVDLEAFRSGVASFESFTTYSPGTGYLEQASGTQRVTTVEADRDFFRVLGVPAIAGRTFDTGDTSQVAVISERMWERMFSRSADVIGQSLSIDGTQFVVLGVMPERFQYPYNAASVIRGSMGESQTDIWLAEYRPTAPERRIGRLSGRLRPGVTTAAAEAQLSGIVSVEVQSVEDAVLSPVRDALWLLFAAVGLVLLAACANVANLLLALAGARVREVATRAALGASRARLARQFLVESLLLSLAGGAVGVLVARWGLSALVAFGAQRIPRAHEIGADWRVFVFSLAVCCGVAVLTSLAPALSSASVGLPMLARELGGRATTNTAARRFRNQLVICEIALAFVLAFAAAAVIRDIERLRRVETGIVAANVTTFHLGQRLLPGIEHQYYDIADRVQSIPGVAAAGFIQVLPLQNWGWGSNSTAFTIEGNPAPQTPPFTIELRYVTPGYFQAMGIPVRRGRGLTVQDDREAPPVILINETLARRYFGDRNPIGIRMNRGTIVGVVGDVRQAGLSEPSVPEIYFPIAQNWSQLGDLGMSIAVRSRLGTPELADRVRLAVREVNPGIVIFNVRTMDQVISDSLWNLNLYRWLIGLFGALTLVLAAAGLYAVISQAVAARQREWAIRLALGSRPADLVRLVLGSGMRLAVSGILAGVVATVLIILWTPGLPINLTMDPALFAVIGLVIVGVTAVAVLLPALRAGSVAPASALKVEG